MLSMAALSAVLVWPRPSPTFLVCGRDGAVSLYGEPGLSAVKDPDPVNPPPKREPIPYQSWAEAKAKTFTAADDPTLACLLPGAPRITSMPEIIQTPKEVVIAYESYHAFALSRSHDKLQHPNG